LVNKITLQCTSQQARTLISRTSRTCEKQINGGSLRLRRILNGTG
jgi:hypothetical protein